MFHHKLDTSPTWGTLLSWFLLSFIAGNVNAGGYLASHRFVTHVTGFATLTGAAMAQGDWRDAFLALLVPVFFLMGVMISGLCIKVPLYRGGRPHYTWAMGAVASGLLLVVVVGAFQGFRKFGSFGTVSEDFFLMAILCLVSGIQNAAITASSGASVRTTHLTGITTDLGLGLVKVGLLPKKSPEQEREWIAIRLRFGTILSFLLGSCVGAYLFFHFHYAGFLLPFGLACFATFLASKEPHLPKVQKLHPVG